MHQLSRPTLQEGKQKQLKARRRHKRHTNTLMQTSSRTLVIPACFHKPYKWCHMHTETACTEVGHTRIYRPKRVTEIPTRTRAHTHACVNVWITQLPVFLGVSFRMTHPSSNGGPAGEKNARVHASSHTVETVNTIKPHVHKKRRCLPSLCAAIVEYFSASLEGNHLKYDRVCV